MKHFVAITKKCLSIDNGIISNSTENPINLPNKKMLK
jgi:hypothetical protein